MSNAGQAVLTIVGTVVGAYFGYPQLGFVLGSLAGQALFPTQLPTQQGPRMGDGQRTVSQIGSPIPLIFGTQTVGGIIVWASPIREQADTSTVGGKGGGAEGEVITYSYYRSFAILLCEGPIGGVRRIWANGKLVYNRAGGGMTPESAEFANTQIASNSWASRMTVYRGTEDQMPDPVIESFEGAGNVPAYRGYAMLVFDDVRLKEADGLRLPVNWKIEVFEEGESEFGAINQYVNEVLHPWSRNDNLFDPRDTFLLNEYEIQAISYRGSTAQAYSTGPKATLSAAIADWTSGWDANNSISITQMRKIGMGNFAETTPGVIPAIFPFPDVAQPLPSENVALAAVWYSELTPVTYMESFDGDGLALLDMLTANGNDFHHPIFFAEGPSIPPAVVYYGEQNSGSGLATEEATNFEDGTHEVFVVNVLQMGVQRSPGPPADPCDVGRLVPDIPGYAVVGGRLVSCGPWTRVEGIFNAMQTYFEDNSFVESKPLDPVLRIGDPRDTQEFWEAAYEIQKARGEMPAGLVYGVDYPAGQTFAYEKSEPSTVIEVQPVSIATIISRICERIGLPQYDVSDLNEKYVVGYQVSRPMQARAAIETLRATGFFDIVESGTQLSFVVRGKAAVVALTDDDLGARFVGDEAPPRITTRKAQELELPRQVRVHYQNYLRDYDPGEELSPSRFDTAAESVLDVDLGVALYPDQAAQIAEVIHQDLWASRWTHALQLDVSKSALEPADCVTVPIDGRQERIRIPTITDRLPNLRVLDAVRDDDGTYVSTAVGTTPQVEPPGMELTGPVEIDILDIAALDPSHNDAGVYVAATPVLVGDVFKGASVYRSVDNGSTYVQVASVSEPTPIGSVIFALPSGPTTVFDEGNELRIELLDDTELEDRTEIDVLGGANAAAIGVHGRWEIVQFKNAVRIAGNVWSLTGLLRGRRGTEHNIGLSQAGDDFVLLSAGTLARVSQTVSDIGREFIYRAAPIGLSPSGAQTITFTSEGVALKPFSPAHVAGSRDSNGSVTITWIPRDRLHPDLETELSEAVEDYEVEILKGGDAIRTISVSDPLAQYSVQQQITDFGSVQGSVTVRIYQMSVAVGRGYAAEATI